MKLNIKKDKMKEVYKQWLMTEDKPHLSKLDIRQRFQFYVFLCMQNRLALAMEGLSKDNRSDGAYIPPEVLGKFALEAFSETIPRETFYAYKAWTEDKIVGEMMSHFPSLIKKFDLLIKQYLFKRDKKN